MNRRRATAFLIGATHAVVAGGAITVGLAVMWRRFFPALATVDRMERLRDDLRDVVVGRVVQAGRPPPRD